MCGVAVALGIMKAVLSFSVVLCECQQLYKRMSAGGESGTMDYVVNGVKIMITMQTRCFIVRADKDFCVHPAAEAAYVNVCYFVIYELDAGSNSFVVPAT